MHVDVFNQVYFLLGVATLRLNRKPVNSLNFDMLTQIAINLEKIQNDKSIKGVIVTSVSELIFSYINKIGKYL